MFYEVRIFSAEGKLRKKVSQKQLTQKHWEKFARMETNHLFYKKHNGAAPNWVKRRLNEQYPDLADVAS